ncbi:MAG TPA: TOBE domain-containing protein [Pseudonocardia sp.]|nr:TOBE domain-containing protein [Pseudonocardia sp.]
MPRLRVAEIAALLSVSNDTVRRWIDIGHLPVVEGVVPRAVEGEDVARLAKDRARPAPDPSGVGRSARNRFVGLVTDVVCDPVMASVMMQCGRHRIEAVMSTEAVRELDLQPGSLAVAVVKATQVLLSTPDPTAARPGGRS